MLGTSLWAGFGEPNRLEPRHDTIEIARWREGEPLRIAEGLDISGRRQPLVDQTVHSRGQQQGGGQGAPAPDRQRASAFGSVQGPVQPVRQAIEVGLADRRIVAGSEFEPAGLNIALDQVVQTGFIDGNLAFVQRGDLFLADIDTGNTGTEFREAGAGDEADFEPSHCYADYATWRAIREAGSKRFRPILLTSLTTFLSLFPLMMEKSMQARFLIPMAISLAFGVVFATFITLVLVPSGYMILEDFHHLMGRRQPAPEAPSQPQAGSSST